jgi:hypothetical protein
MLTSTISTICDLDTLFSNSLAIGIPRRTAKMAAQQQYAEEDTVSLDGDEIPVPGELPS